MGIFAAALSEKKFTINIKFNPQNLNRKNINPR